MLGRTTVIALMVLGFAAPALNSGAKDARRGTPLPDPRHRPARSCRGSASACELSQMSVALTRQTSLLEQLLQASINPAYDRIGDSAQAREWEVRLEFGSHFGSQTARRAQHGNGLTPHAQRILSARSAPADRSVRQIEINRSDGSALRGQVCQ